MNKMYMGDGVYVESVGFGSIKVTTEGGIATDNAIFMDKPILQGLINYIEATYD